MFAERVSHKVLKSDVFVCLFSGNQPTADFDFRVFIQVMIIAGRGLKTKVIII